MVRLRVRFSDVRMEIPIHGKDIYPRVNEQLSPYILFGFNDSVTNTELIRIETDQMENTTHFIEATLNPHNYAVTGILSELFLPVQFLSKRPDS